MLSTRTQYDTRQIEEKIGPFSFKIQCLENLEKTIDQLFEALETDGKPELLETLCPYFGTLWESGRALAQELVAIGSSRLSDRSILEIGCGLALPSMVASRLGARVTASDSHPAVEGFLKTNLSLNSISGLRYARSSWIDPTQTALGLYDWVVASDVLYERTFPKPLAAFLDRHLAKDGTALVSDPGRSYLQEFTDAMRDLSFRCESSVRTVMGPDRPQNKDVFILRFDRA